MIGRDAAFYDRLFEVCTALMETIHRVPQPVIAKVHGIATAAGCQLVASCDLAVAAEATRFLRYVPDVEHRPHNGPRAAHDQEGAHLARQLRELLPRATRGLRRC